MSIAIQATHENTGRRRRVRKKEEDREEVLAKCRKVYEQPFFEESQEVQFWRRIQRSPSSLLIKFTASVKEMEVVGAEI